MEKQTRHDADTEPTPTTEAPTVPLHYVAPPRPVFANEPTDDADEHA